MKYKIKPKFNILIKAIQDENDKKLDNKIKELNDPSLTFEEKRIKVLSEEKTTTYQYETFDINIKKIKEEREAQINKKVEQIKDPKLSELEKILIVLSQEKTTTYIFDPNRNQQLDKDKPIESQKDLIISPPQHPSLVLPTDTRTSKPEKIIIEKIEESPNILSISQQLDSSLERTRDTTLNSSDMSFSISSDINKSQNFSKSIASGNLFNSAKIDYYTKYKLFDISINIVDSKLPKSQKISDKQYAFLYENDFITYCLSGSQFLLKHELKIIEENKDDKVFYQDLGLYFCGKEEEVPTKEEKEKKRCSPNIFMCKDCMKKNKKIYGIKDKHLINIKGRISKKNKGKYHCFGHFEISNQIEDCVISFSCKSCQILDKLEEYYMETK